MAKCNFAIIYSLEAMRIAYILIKKCTAPYLCFASPTRSTTFLIEYILIYANAKAINDQARRNDGVKNHEICVCPGQRERNFGGIDVVKAESEVTAS